MRVLVRQIEGFLFDNDSLLFEPGEGPRFASLLRNDIKQCLPLHRGVLSKSNWGIFRGGLTKDLRALSARALAINVELNVAFVEGLVLWTSEV